MKYFNKITRKQFVDAMTSTDIAFVSGGYTEQSLNDELFEKRIIEDCNRIDLNEHELCRCSAKSNYLLRRTGTGDSRINLDGCNYYYVNNILVIEGKHELDERHSLCIYLYKRI